MFAVALFCFVISGSLTFSNSEDPETYMSTTELIHYFGYPSEVHNVTTEDGYILEIHRIPWGRRRTQGPRTPVMVQHGIFCSSSDSVINFPHQSIGFKLADNGYDVWLTNIRGNNYGRRHVTLNPEADDQFWKFSWDQMGQYDVPAMIDYILSATGYSELYYVGHSMGTSMAFAMLSTKPEYNRKIRLFAAAAPVATLTTAKTAVRALAPFSDIFSELLQFIGTAELLPSHSPLIGLFAPFCDDQLSFICSNIVFLVCGFNPSELNTSRMDVYTHHTPAGQSAWTLTHYAQIIKNGKFQPCNYGRSTNIDRYGQDTPREYNLTEVTVPVALFWAENDYLAAPLDVELLRDRLPNVVSFIQIGDKNFAHLDFFWGINAGTVFVPQLMEQLPRF